MTAPINGWIMRRHLRAFLELLSRYGEYAFDEVDWATIEAGLEATDDETAGDWYSYPLVGRGATLKIKLAQAVGGDEVSVEVEGVETPELALRTDTLLSAYSSV